jgi:hypothetical protein
VMAEDSSILARHAMTTRTSSSTYNESEYSMCNTVSAADRFPTWTSRAMSGRMATISAPSPGYKGAATVTDSAADLMRRQCNRGRSAATMLH